MVRNTPTPTYGRRPTLSILIYLPPLCAPIVPIVFLIKGLTTAVCRRLDSRNEKSRYVLTWLRASDDFEIKKYFFKKNGKKVKIFKSTIPQTGFYCTVNVTVPNLVFSTFDKITKTSLNAPYSSGKARPDDFWENDVFD